MFGYVLTGAKNIEELYRITKALEANTIKIITAWGLDWENQTEGNRRALICSLTPHTVVRTRVGDPSSNGSLHPVPEIVIGEIQPWYAVKRDIIIEIGNEPNTHSSDTNYIYEYRWYLAKTILACRALFPHAKIMSTALQPDKEVQKWHTVFSEQGMNVYNMCDYVGVHAYEHKSFNAPQTNHYTKMLDIFKSQRNKLFFSELGINGTNVHKLSEYREVAKNFPVTYYHYNSYRDVDSSYHVEVL